MNQSLKSLSTYSHYVAATLDRVSVEHSTVRIWPNSPYTDVAEGEIYLTKGFRLRLREELDFDAGLITAYGYEVYQGAQKLYWYDDFPHPHDPTLAATFPHHKHVPPDIKRHRIPAPDIRATRPNPALLIQEIEALIAT